MVARPVRRRRWCWSASRRPRAGRSAPGGADGSSGHECQAHFRGSRSAAPAAGVTGRRARRATGLPEERGLAGAGQDEDLQRRQVVQRVGGGFGQFELVGGQDQQVGPGVVDHGGKRADVRRLAHQLEIGVSSMAAWTRSLIRRGISHIRTRVGGRFVGHRASVRARGGAVQWIPRTQSDPVDPGCGGPGRSRWGSVVRVGQRPSGLAAVLHLELAQDVVDVVLHRRHGDVQPRRAICLLESPSPRPRRSPAHAVGRRGGDVRVHRPVAI